MPSCHCEEEAEMETGPSELAAKFRLWQGARGLLGHVESLAVGRFGLRKATVDLMFVPDVIVNTGQSRGSPGIGWILGTHRFSPCDCLLERLLGVLPLAGIFLHQGIIPVMFNQESSRPRQSRSLCDQLLKVRH